MPRNLSPVILNQNPLPGSFMKAFKKEPFPFFIFPEVQNYDWGETGPRAYIPRLLGARPEKGKAYAELWIGAHPVKPASVMGGELGLWAQDWGAIGLNDLIEQAPKDILGPKVARRFGGQLPFLMKVLCAEKALSIQAHPNLRQAREGFAREEALGIPRNASHRNYKDANHKPELIIALTDFYALNGFRSLREVAAIWESVPELGRILDACRSRPALPRQGRGFLKLLYEKCMTMGQEEVNAALTPVLERIRAEERRRAFSKRSVEGWILKADREYSGPGRKDRGLFSFFLLNFLALKPGQGMSLDAGELHAYLHGAGVEVMANSDNVLRGGLTSKHVDIPELLKTLTFREGRPRIVLPDSRGIYKTAAPEFEIAAVAKHNARRARRVRSVEILFLLKGTVRIETRSRSLLMRRGQTVFVPANVEKYSLTFLSAGAEIYRCSIPIR